MESLLYVNLGQAASLSALNNRLVTYAPAFVHLSETTTRLPKFFLDSKTVLHHNQRGVGLYVQPVCQFLEIHKSKLFDLVLAVVSDGCRVSFHCIFYLTPNPTRHYGLQNYSHARCVQLLFAEICEIHEVFRQKHKFDDEYVSGDLNMDLAAGDGRAGKVVEWFQLRKFISCMPGFTHQVRGSCAKIDLCYVRTSDKFAFHKIGPVEARAGHAGCYVYPMRFDDDLRVETFDQDGYVRYFNENPLVLTGVSVHEKVDLFFTEMERVTRRFKQIKFIKGAASSQYSDKLRADFESVTEWTERESQLLMDKFNTHMDGKRNFFDFSRTFLLGDSRKKARDADPEKIKAFCSRQTQKNAQVRKATYPDFTYPDPVDPWRPVEMTDGFYQSRLHLTAGRVGTLVDSLTDSGALQYSVALSNKIAKKCHGLHGAIASIINSIITEGKFPSKLKVSRVTPVQWFFLKTILIFCITFLMRRF